MSTHTIRARLVALSLAVATAGCGSSEHDSVRPDVLLICSDTHRYDYAFEEPGKHLMPTLQELGSEAVFYRHGFSTASWTLPAIASALTGLEPRLHRSGELQSAVPADDFDADNVPEGQFAFKTGDHYRLLSTYPGQLTSLPERLAAEGYETAVVASNPLYFLSGLAQDGVDHSVDTGVVAGEAVNEAAFELLSNQPPDRPLFMLVHYMDAHQWEKWYFDHHHPALDRHGAPDEVRASYRQAVADTDRHLSSLLARWKSLRDWDNTLGVFFSDHGEQLLDQADDPRLGHGNSMDDLLLRTPMLVKYPRATGIHPGTVDSTVSLVDLVPTVLSLLGIQYEAERLSGRSLIGLRAESDESPRTLFADYQLYDNALSSVRQGTHKLIIDLDNQTSQLVDWRSGRTLDDETERATAIRSRLLRAFREYRRAADEATAHLAFDRSVDQQRAADQLRALGYLE